MNVAQQHPARTDSNGTTWYRPVREPGMTADQANAWTSNPLMAHPDYDYDVLSDSWNDGQGGRATMHGLHRTTEENHMAATALDVTGAEVTARFTEWQRYPLPPEPPRVKPVYNHWGQYGLPSPSTGRKTYYSRATTIADTLDDTYNLNQWKTRTQVIAVIRLQADANAGVNYQLPVGHKRGQSVPATQLLTELYAEIANGNTNKINPILELIDNLTGGRESAELGECVHAWLEALDIGTVVYDGLPDFIKPYADAYYDVLARHALVPVSQYVERIVLNEHELKSVAGTIDRIYLNLKTSTLFLGDVKTSKTLQYGYLSYGTQFNIYGRAKHMLAADGSGWEPMPAIDQTMTYCVHVPSDQPERSSCVPFDMPWCDEALTGALRAREMRTDAKNKVPVHGLPIPDEPHLRWTAAYVAISHVSAPAQMAAIWEQYQDVWEMIPGALQMRAEQIVALVTPKEK